MAFLKNSMFVCRRGESFGEKRCITCLDHGMNAVSNTNKEKDFEEEAMKLSSEGKFLVRIDESDVNLFIRGSIRR